MADLRLCGKRMGPGELKAGEYLAAHLPESWRILCNIRVWDYGGTSNEVDFLIIGDHGLYVVDEKHWDGEVTIGTHVFRFGGSKTAPNPVEKTERVSAIVAAQVRESLPNLAVGVGSGFFVFGYVVLSSPPSRLVVEDEAVANKVYLLDETPERLRDLDGELKRRQAAGSPTVSAFLDALTKKYCRPFVTSPVRAKEGEPQLITSEPDSPPEDPKTARRHRRSPLHWIPVACLVASAIVFTLLYQASKPVRWDAAREHIGKTGAVYGPVVKSVKRPNSGDITFIDIGREFRPNEPTPFYLRIDPEYRTAFEAEIRQITGGSPSPWDAYGGKTTWVEGKVLQDDYRGAYMLVTSAKQIHVGEPIAQSGYLAVAIAAAVLAVVWAAALMVRSARRAGTPARQDRIAS